MCLRHQPQTRPGGVTYKLRDEVLNGEIFYTLKEAQILIADWRRLYNGLRPHSALGQRPPALETIVWPGFSLADYIRRQRSHPRRLWHYHRKWTTHWGQVTLFADHVSQAPGHGR